MRLDGDTLVAKSEQRWFSLEKNGRKPNTIRLVDEPEWDMIREAVNIRVVDAMDGRRHFTREISGVFRVAHLLGKTLVVICWEK